MSNTLEQAVIAITGAGSGIGKALAMQAASHNMRIALSDIALDKLEVTCGELKLQYPECQVMINKLDVTDKDAFSNWANDINTHFGEINIIINNAGVALSSSVSSMNYEDFEWLMDINFWGVVYGSKAFLPFIENAQWGHIINISSLFGLISTPNTSAYNASKFAVRGFTESLRIEMAITHPNIAVSCVHPGGIKTNIANASRDGGDKVGKAGRMSREESRRDFNERLAKTTPEQAAQIIFDGIAKKKARILVGSDAKMLDLIQRFLPTRYQSIVKKILG
ncbi:SDR family NAD(P)-dependent oxidoreductase [Alteromonadaceae bacterium M269]|nr:SDR family NAD(P)-dependent oxidoreductase [Alteromonadaceae bacterium M269]